MSLRARIYRQPQSPTQSGHGGAGEWVLDYPQPRRREVDPLMGWIGGGDTQTQVRLRFDTAADAEAYARGEGIAFETEIAHERRVKPKAYADNFKFGRSENWTH